MPYNVQGLLTFKWNRLLFSLQNYTNIDYSDSATVLSFGDLTVK